MKRVAVKCDRKKINMKNLFECSPGNVVGFNISEMGLLSPEEKGLEKHDRHEHAQRSFSIKGEEIGHCRLDS